MASVYRHSNLSLYYSNIYTWAVLREKVPNGRARPSFGMTPTFWIIFEKIIFFLEKSVSYQKKGGCGPSFFWYDNDSGHWGPFRVVLPT